MSLRPRLFLRIIPVPMPGPGSARPKMLLEPPAMGDEDAAMWTGKASIQPGWALFSGTAGDHSLHRHHAVQLAIGLTGAIELRVGTGNLIRAPGIVIPADHSHQLVSGPNPLLLLYLERESSQGRRLDQWCGPGPRALTEAQCRRLVELLSANTAGVLEQVIADLLGSAPAASEHPFMDPRIQDCLAALPRPLPESLSGAHLAKKAGLSSSRFAHLFRAHTGMPLRPYLRWLRLQHALAAIAHGLNLTEAAHASGFSDSAHLSRSFRSTFGIAPNVLLHPLLSLRANA